LFGIYITLIKNSSAKMLRRNKKSPISEYKRLLQEQRSFLMKVESPESDFSDFISSSWTNRRKLVRKRLKYGLRPAWSPPPLERDEKWPIEDPRFEKALRERLTGQ
jgi:hypothetical protein